MRNLAKNSSPAGKRKAGLAGELEQPGSNSRQAKYVLRLYVSGSTSKSALAVENIKRICEQHLKSRYDLRVVDIYQQPNLARVEQIVAVPTLIKRFPPPLRRLIGDLSNPREVLFGLELGNVGAIGGSTVKTAS
jgi:circadian clock protein KaiB